ncbi:DUF6364 family protein [uncultured Endozoicomonas sp.]|uniref:DUF6364 family protein n=1 Tax=uncultured Endozoicomonas sp. TaxID=432652 RepID=UPI00262F9747|nr:DUF6364 family protein [uncultured Endozoicomonas sp.]
MSKLTLTVDPAVIELAKRYAASQEQSLSKLVENYLKTLPKTPTPDEPALELTGLVAELAGVLDDKTISADRAEYIDYLQDKYQ